MCAHTVLSCPHPTFLMKTSLAAHAHLRFSSIQSWPGVDVLRLPHFSRSGGQLSPNSWPPLCTRVWRFESRCSKASMYFEPHKTLHTVLELILSNHEIGIANTNKRASAPTRAARVFLKPSAFFQPSEVKVLYLSACTPWEPGCRAHVSPIDLRASCETKKPPGSNPQIRVQFRGFSCIVPRSWLHLLSRA